MFGKAFRNSALSGGFSGSDQETVFTGTPGVWSFGRRWLILLLVMGYPLQGSSALGEEPDKQRLEYFQKQVRPLLVDYCFECHDKKNGPDNGGLVLETVEGMVAGGSRGRLFDPADPDGSLLLQAVQFEEDDLQMPPSGKMSEKQIQVIRKWLEDGAILPKPLKDRPLLPMMRGVTAMKFTLQRKRIVMGGPVDYDQELMP